MLYQEQGGSGDGKNYIFKDGVFKIQPTTNQFTLNASTKHLTTSTRLAYLLIPYAKTGETVFVKCKGVVNMNLGLNVTTTSTSAYDMTTPYYFGNGVKDYVIISLPTDKHIMPFNFSSSAQMEIIEIWTEKVKE